MNDNEELIINDIMRDLTLMQDGYMSKFFEGNCPAAEEVLRVILNRQDLHVLQVKTQKTLLSILGREARLDIVAQDDMGKYYDIEIQNTKSGFSFQRARLNASLLDTYITQKGMDYQDMPEVYIIFIMGDDYIGDGLPIYEVKKIIAQTGKFVNDGVHYICVTGTNNADDPLGRLMDDFHNSNPATMNYPALRARSMYLKEDKQGRLEMSELIRKGFKKQLQEVEAKAEKRGEARGESKGRKEGEAEREKSIVEVMLKAKEPIDKIMFFTQLPLKKIQEIASNIGIEITE